MSSCRRPVPGRRVQARRTTTRSHSLAVSHLFGCGQALRGEALQDDGRHLLDRLRGGVDDGQAVGSEQCLSPTQLPRALLEGGIGGVGPALLPNLTQPGRRCDNAVAPVAQRLNRSGQLGLIEILVDQRIVGDEDAVLQRQVHSRWRLAAPGRRHKDHVCLVQSTQTLPVVVLDGILDGGHPGVVALDVADAMEL